MRFERDFESSGCYRSCSLMYIYKKKVLYFTNVYKNRINHTSVLCVCIRTFLTLFFRSIRGELPKPGFWIPKSSLLGFGRGFFKLDLNGPRDVIIVDTDPSVNVDPFDTDVIVVVTEPILPAYGLPDDAVIEIPLSVI